MPANVEEMMYTGNVPWHGLGTYVGDEPLESEEAIRKSGLDWTVTKMQLLFEESEGVNHKAQGWHATVRESDKALLGVVTDRYQVIQNSEAFSFMDALVQEGKVRYHTAGSLASGKRIWMLAELPDTAIEVVPKDIVQPYLLLSNGHDGKQDLHVLWTSVRVVCQNTLNIALKEAATKYSVRHTGDMGLKLNQAQEILGLAGQNIVAFREFAQHLAKRTLTDKAFDDFLAKLVPLPPDDVSPTRVENIRSTIQYLYAAGPGAEIDGVAGTAWGALQAVTDFTTHHRSTRGGGKTALGQQEKRLESVWFGTGADLNRRAMDLLVA